MRQVTFHHLLALALGAVGRRPKIDGGLAHLIRDYIAAVAEAVDLMVRSGIPRPPSNFEWVGTLIPQSGELVGGIRYFSHGFGCWVDLPSGSVDFDFREHGEIDGFDFDRLKNFAKDRLPNYGFATEQSLNDAFQAAKRSGAIARDRYGGHLYTLH